MINKSEYQMLTSLKPITLEGDYITRTIRLNSFILDSESSKTVFINTKSGFDWGNSEEGSAQLALAILLNQTNDKKISMILYHAFKNDIILNLPESDFKKTINIGEWLYNNICKDYIL
jgi:hypothetical protein